MNDSSNSYLDIVIFNHLKCKFSKIDSNAGSFMRRLKTQKSEIRQLRMIPTPVVRKTLGQITDEGIMNRQESSKIIKRIKQSANR